MNTESPDRDLTPEEQHRYQILKRQMDEAGVEAEIRDILAHPESWASSDEILKDVEAICGKAKEKPNEA